MPTSSRKCKRPGDETEAFGPAQLSAQCRRKSGDFRCSRNRIVGYTAQDVKPPTGWRVAAGRLCRGFSPRISGPPEGQSCLGVQTRTGRASQRPIFLGIGVYFVRALLSRSEELLSMRPPQSTASPDALPGGNPQFKNLNQTHDLDHERGRAMTENDLEPGAWDLAAEIVACFLESDVAKLAKIQALGCAFAWLAEQPGQLAPKE